MPVKKAQHILRSLRYLSGAFLPAAFSLLFSFTAAAETVPRNVLDSAVTSEAPQERGSLLEGAAPPATFGWIERVILSPELRWKLEAKLDTGADTSSLDAHDIRRVKFKGKSYVRFSIKNPESGEMVSLRRPYVRTVRIRRHSGNHQRRRVVLMTVCLGAAERTIEVTLTDREFFDYPMLLGRSALSGLAVVNPMATYTTEPDCKSGFDKDMESDDALALSDKSGSEESGVDRTQVSEEMLLPNKAVDDRPESVEKPRPDGDHQASCLASGVGCGEAAGVGSGVSFRYAHSCFASAVSLRIASGGRNHVRA